MTPERREEFRQNMTLWMANGWDTPFERRLIGFLDECLTEIDAQASASDTLNNAREYVAMSDLARRDSPRNRYDAITYKLEAEAREASRFAQALPDQRGVLTSYRMRIQNIATLAIQELGLVDTELAKPPIQRGAGL